MIEYVNRLGETYYLLQGTTKTGKPKYYVSRKTKGTPADKMPEGFEFYENPERGLVSLRKIRPSPILPIERQTIEREARRAGIEYFLVDVQEESLVVYTPGNDPAETVNALSKMLGPFAGLQRDWIAQRGYYMPMFRFTLVDEKRRLFAAERWCYRGSIDGWWSLHDRQPLNDLARKYLPHLNKESFFELM
jgi:hypothetical protein